MKLKYLYCMAFLGLLGACSSEPEEPAGERVNRIANEFVAAYYAQFPEEVYEVGYPDAPMDRFGDHSEEATRGWDARVDQWLDMAGLHTAR